VQTGFGELPHLRALDLSHNLFDRAPALTNPRLTWLNLSHNWLSDLRGLAGVPQLQYLDVSHNEPLDLSQLNHMTGLVWLDASSPITW
jgi:Leucine-rich repeat (LRR) protein